VRKVHALALADPKDRVLKVTLVLSALISFGVSSAIGFLALRDSGNAEAERAWFTVGTDSAVPASCFAPRVLTDSHDSDSLAIADLDEDGRPDLATPDLEANAVAVLSNTGDGRFEDEAEYRTGTSPDEAAVGDLNGDGLPDIATSNANGSVSVLLNAGARSFRPSTDYRVGGVLSSVAIGDLDGDAAPDLLVTKQAAKSTSSVLLNRGDGTFESAGEYPTGRVVALGDLDGDGRQDLAALDTERTVAVRLNRGGARFAPRAGYRTGDGPTSLAIGDLDSDGKLDLATANYGIEPMGVGNTVSVLLNEGAGRFGRNRDYETPEYPTSVEIADATGDGKPDLVTTNAETKAITVLPNRGNGTFGARLDYPEPAKPGGAASASVVDVNGDGESDLVMNESGSVSVLLNRPGPCAGPGFEDTR
jgi:hypothetical protein